MTQINLQKKFFPWAVLVFLASLVMTEIAFSANANRIELDDGSVIVGKIVSLSDGVYRVETESLGTVSLSASTVRSIQRENFSAPRSGSVAVGQGARSQSLDLQSQQQKIQNRLMSNPDAVEIIQGLQNNAAMQNILKNPDLMKAITQGDLETLGRSPDIQALMNNPTVRDIIEQNR